MSNDSITIPADTARHALWHYGAAGGYQPGSFTQKLMEAIDAADMDNVEILRTAYPVLVTAMLAAKLDPQGIDRLQKAAGETSGEETQQPTCPEALYDPDTDVLLRCVLQGPHDWHQTPGGVEWRPPIADPSAPAGPLACECGNTAGPLDLQTGRCETCTESAA